MAFPVTTWIPVNAIHATSTSDNLTVRSLQRPPGKESIVWWKHRSPLYIFEQVALCNNALDKSHISKEGCPGRYYKLPHQAKAVPAQDTLKSFKSWSDSRTTQNPFRLGVATVVVITSYRVGKGAWFCRQRVIWSIDGWTVCAKP